jgi:hypothetical protein
MATEYENESTNSLENITLETGVLVVSFFDETDDNASVAYYSDMNDFNEAWQVQNKCPITEKEYYVSMSLSALTEKQLSSLLDKNTNRLSEGVLSGNANTLTTECFRKYIAKEINILKILETFESKISNIKHNEDAKEAARNLHKELKTLAIETFSKEPSKDKVSSFSKSALELISSAVPALQKDLGWGDYLSNLAKEICNAATRTLSFGYHNGLFSIKKSDVVTEAEKLQDSLSDKPTRR